MRTIIQVEGDSPQIRKWTNLAKVLKLKVVVYLESAEGESDAPNEPKDIDSGKSYDRSGEYNQTDWGS